MERVFIVLPVHNRRRVTEKFVDCLQSQTFQNYHLILVDDGSTDGTADAVKARLESVSVIRGPGNWWWSGCMQQAYRWLLSNDCDDEDFVMLANDDIMFGPDFIFQAVRTLAHFPDALLGAQLLDPASNKVRESGVHADLRRFVFRVAETSGQINCLPTRALLLRWKDMKRVGAFHPYLLPHYFGDYEYTLRATRRGLQCFTTPEVAVIADFGTTGYHDLDSLVGWSFLRRLFSVKAPLNPLYRTAFVTLASPGLWKLVNLFDIWARAGFRIIWQGLLRLRFPRKAVRKVFS